MWKNVQGVEKKQSTMIEGVQRTTISRWTGCDEMGGIRKLEMSTVCTNSDEGWVCEGKNPVYMHERKQASPAVRKSRAREKKNATMG